MKNKLIAIVLSLTICILPFGIANSSDGLSAFAEETLTNETSEAKDNADIHIWDGTADTSWYDEEETSFEISTPEELAGLVELSDKGYTMEGQTITLTADLYLNDVSSYDEWKTGSNTIRNWVQIKKFSGVFDGGEHTIYGLYQYGLFQDIKDGSIKNVNIDKALFFSAGGAICKKNDKGLITNCNVKGRFAAPINKELAGTFLWLGGITGENNFGTILYCKNYADIDLQFSFAFFEPRVGGICGYNEGGTIIGCTNHGTINVKNYEACVGGVSGLASGLIKECSNYGVVNIDCSDSHVDVGGVVGCGSCVSIIDCYNRADLRIHARLAYFGTEYFVQGNEDNNGKSKSIKIKYDPSIGKVDEYSKIRNCYSTNITTHINEQTTEYTDKYYYSNDGNQTLKTLANMKKKSFADSLGTPFVYVEGDYPILAWERFSGYVKFDPDIIHLEKIGQQHPLSLITTYSAAPKYMSADPNVADVDQNGVVTATGRGETEIYAIYSDQTAICLIQNYSDTYKLNTKTMSVERGKTEELYFVSDFDNEKLDDLTASFTSSKPAIATVDKTTGKVTGVGYGTCKITATVDKQTYSCEVTVTEPITEPTEPTTEPEVKYSLNTQTLSLEVGKAQEISVIGNAGTVKWMSSDPKIVNIKGNGLKATVNGVAEGTASIYAILTGGQTLECEVTVTAKVVPLGDVTMDGKFSVSDIIAVQKWILGQGKLSNWENADFDKNGQIDVFDLALMKRELISSVTKN